MGSCSNDCRLCTIKIDLPTVVKGDLAVVGLAQIGGREPSIEVCWVPDCGWDDFSEQILDLLEAGYPGCIGCGGPGAEEEWNEDVRRDQFLSKKITLNFYRYYSTCLKRSKPSLQVSPVFPRRIMPVVVIAEKPSVAADIAKVLGVNSKQDTHWAIRYGLGNLGRRSFIGIENALKNMTILSRTGENPSINFHSFLMNFS